VSERVGMCCCCTLLCLAFRHYARLSADRLIRQYQLNVHFDLVLVLKDKSTKLSLSVDAFAYK